MVAVLLVNFVHLPMSDALRFRLGLNQVNRLLSIFGLALLTGCVGYQSKPISPAQAAVQFDARRLDDAGLKNFLEKNLGHELNDWPRVSWDLDSFTLAAFYFQPDLEVARAQWRVAQAGIKTAGARPNPTVTVGPGYNFSALAGVNPWMPFGSFDLPIETAGKRGKRLAQARHQAASARQNFIAAAWQVRGKVRANLLELTVAEGRETEVEKQFSAQREIVQRLEQRLAVGEISREELTPARVALSKAQLDLSDAQTKLAVARAQLAGLLGLSAEALRGVRFDFDLGARPAEDLTSDDARRVALCGRADVLGALADYAADEADLRLEIAKQFPDLHLNPGYQFDQGDHKWTLGFTFELPVFNQNRGPIREAGARRELAAAKFTALQAQVIGAIERAVAELRAARNQRQTSEELFADAQKQWQSANERFKAGASDRVDVLSTQLEFSSAALARLDTLARLQTAVAALEDALQRPTDSVAAAIAALNSRKP